MYIGSVNTLANEKLWVLNEPKSGKVHFSQETVDFNPGLYKIFDEILVNAVDNVQRDKNTNRIEVNLEDIYTERPKISVWNNGKGVPVRKHKTEKIYIPQLVFGYLLTGSNFTDEASKYTGGRHGYGAKLTNIFSKEFTIETQDTKKSLTYSQKWTDNMNVCFIFFQIRFFFRTKFC
eukprot:GSMAST32.ASY1.ANO1.2515.1 assembled CDS